MTDNINKQLDDPLDSSAQQFTDLLSSTNLTQNVSVSTHIHNHTLDFVITSHTNLSPTISHSFITVPDHFPIFTHLNRIPTLPPQLLNLSSVAPKTSMSLNSITTSPHPIKFYVILHHNLNCLIARIPHYAQFLTSMHY